MTIVVRLEYTSVHIIKAQTAVARERQRSAETVLITIIGETVSQHTKKLAIMEERADTDAAIASQETVKIFNICCDFSRVLQTDSSII